MEKKISDILHSIDNGEYKIPEFQRGYVWKRRRLDFFDMQEYKDVIAAKENYPSFEELFGKKGTLEVRFNQISELRNSIRHSRDVTDATIKDGEAAIAWFGSVIMPYVKKIELEKNQD